MSRQANGLHFLVSFLLLLSSFAVACLLALSFPALPGGGQLRGGSERDWKRTVCES